MVVRFLQLQALGIRGGADSGRERVAGIDRHVHDAAALHAVAIAPGALREHLAHEVAVVVRIGVDDAAHRAVFGGHLRLDAAPGPAVARDHDRALDGNAQAFELLVVVRNAVVHVDERRGDVAVDGVGVVGGKLLVVLVRGGVLRQPWAPASFAVKRVGSSSSTARSLGVGKRTWKVSISRRDPQSLNLPRIHCGVIFVIGRADVVRARGEPLHVSADVGGIGQRTEFGLPFPLLHGRFGRVAAQGRRVACRSREERQPGQASERQKSSAMHVCRGIQ